MAATVPATRDCLDCGAKDGMRLQNVILIASTGIALFYICQQCGTQLTIPPPPLADPEMPHG